MRYPESHFEPEIDEFDSDDEAIDLTNLRVTPQEKYPKTFIIIDASEVFIETPNDLQLHYLQRGPTTSTTIHLGGVYS